MEKPYNPNNLIEQPTTHYKALFASGDPAEMAERTGAAWDGERFTLRVLDEEKTVGWPDFADEGWSDKGRILFMRYLLEGKRAPVHTGFLTYREMPWGSVYETPFRGRCISRLAGTYGMRPSAFRTACERIGGKAISGSGIGFELEYLPDLFLRFILWEGDEEFPATAQILFSDNFPEVFSPEDRVVVCEETLRRLKQAER